MSSDLDAGPGGGMAAQIGHSASRGAGSNPDAADSASSYPHDPIDAARRARPALRYAGRSTPPVV